MRRSGTPGGDGMRRWIRMMTDGPPSGLFRHTFGAEEAMRPKVPASLGLAAPVMSVAFIALAGALHLHYQPLASISCVAAQSRAPAQAPIFEVDPYWPKPLPNHWVLGSTIGLSVDAQDHVWIIHRPQT